MTIPKEAIEALESARAHILDAYRIWQADDVSAVPPPKSGAGVVIAKIDAVLSSPIAVEGKVPEGWQLVPISATLEMEHAAVARVKPFHDEDWYRVMPKDLFRLAWKALLNAAPIPPSSPGKDGGQEVEAEEVSAKFLDRLSEALGRISWYDDSDNRLTTAQMADRLIARVARARAAENREEMARFGSTQPASTALVEALRELLAHTDPYRDGRGTDAEISARRKAVLALNGFDSHKLLASAKEGSGQ